MSCVTWSACTRDLGRIWVVTWRDPFQPTEIQVHIPCLYSIIWCCVDCIIFYIKQILLYILLFFPGLVFFSFFWCFMCFWDLWFLLSDIDAFLQEHECVNTKLHLVTDFIFCLFLEKIFLLFYPPLNEGLLIIHSFAWTESSWPTFFSCRWYGCPFTEDILAEPIHWGLTLFCCWVWFDFCYLF